MWEEAKKAIRKCSPESSIYIGTDSQCYKRRKKDKNGKPFTEFYANYATVVIVHHDTCRGCEVFYNIESQPDYGNIRMRMITEAGMSVMTAMEMKDEIGNRNFEIHLDINASDMYKSHSAAKEAIGYVTGTLGITAKIKPDAPAASYAADKCVKTGIGKRCDNKEKVDA